MKFVTWNVNGLRAGMQKGFEQTFHTLAPDIMALQETKLQSDQLPFSPPGYTVYLNCAEKKGYSGTALYCAQEPLQVQSGIGIAEHDTEGRVLTAEYPEFYFVNCYTPNAQEGLARIEYRMAWEEAFLTHLKTLDQSKPVILCGDLNVAHEEIDLKNPKANRGNAGFSDQERQAMTRLLQSGFTDVFRARNPGLAGAYTWWSYRFHARQTNAGWRIDYFLVSDRLMSRVEDCIIHSQIEGSDHCPVELRIR